MFHHIYDKILTSEDLPHNHFHSDTEKVCRFCGKTYPDVTFNNRPHIIPELLGRNDFVSDFECDKCNKILSNFENNLSTFIQPYLTICGLKTKKKIPTFESRKDELEELITIKRNENRVEFNFGRNLKDFQYSDNGQSLSVNLRKKPYIPFLVYKSLVKIALSILPEREIENCVEIFNWLKNDTEILCFSYLIKTRLNSKMYKEPYVSIHKAKHVHKNGNEYPEYTVLIGTANLVLQFFLPMTLEHKKKHVANSSLKFEVFPASIIDEKFEKTESGKVKFDYRFTKYDLSSMDKLTEDEKITLTGNKIPKC